MRDRPAQTGRHGKALLSATDLLGHADLPRDLLPESLQFGQLVSEVPGVGDGLYALMCGYGQKFREAPIECAHFRTTCPLYRR
ncbi:MAG TPA: hypothetical protein VMV40_01165, partial [Acidiferrobacter sp.]|nr:hypothetical protein [Acidiferrobacter sp.]